MLRRRTLPPVTCTAQRPQRPCPPHGCPMSIPARRAASTSTVLVGTWTRGVPVVAREVRYVCFMHAQAGHEVSVRLFCSLN